MRWYDYIVCILIADFMAACIMTGSILVVLPVFWYMVYEDYRKLTVTNRRQ